MSNSMSMGRGNRARRQQAIIEALPSRTLLSVTLAAGELRINGTDQADRIAVAATPFINALVVDDNNVRQYYALSAIKTIVVFAGAGDDRVTVDPALNGMEYGCTLLGEAGNDTVTGSGGKVHVRG